MTGPLDKLVYISPHRLTSDNVVDYGVARSIAQEVLSRCRGLGCIKAANTLVMAALIIYAESTASMVESIDSISRLARRASGARPAGRDGDRRGEAGVLKLPSLEGGSEGLGGEREKGEDGSRGERG